MAKPMKARMPKGSSPKNKGHKYGIGSLAEPCKICGTGFAYAYYYPKRCPGKTDRDFRAKAEMHHRKIFKY